MAEPSPIFSPINEEIARIKWLEAFMRGRVELEQMMISGLQALLKGAPPLPERKLLWHCALEKLLDGAREELDIRMEELETLAGQMQTMGPFIAEADLFTRDVNFKFGNLASTDRVDSAQAATATSYKDWCDIKSVNVSAPKGLSRLLSSSRAQRAQKQQHENEKTLKAQTAFQKYYEQDLIYRRTVHQQRQSREQFLNSIPHRVQEYGTKYWTAVCDLGMAMESLANYLRNISSTCSSSGSALWALAKNIKPLVDANCHTEAIEFVYHQPPGWFPPIYYRNPGCKSFSPSGQPILFGCPLELRIVGEQKRIPLILEYLLDSDYDPYMRSLDYHPVEKGWRLLNKIEQAWTGVEKNDRAFISQLVQRGHLSLLILAYFTAIPNPVLSDDDIVDVRSGSCESASLTWNTWSQDPIKAGILQAILSCQSRFRLPGPFRSVISIALGQNKNYSKIWDLLRILDKHPKTWRSPAGNINPEEESLYMGYSN